MKSLPPAVLLTLWALLVQVPAGGRCVRPAQKPAPAPTPAGRAPRDVATHATKGVVKSADARRPSRSPA